MIILEDGQHLRVIVPQWNGGNLGVDVQQNVIVHIDQIISNRLVVIGKQLDRACLLLGKGKAIQIINYNWKEAQRMSISSSKNQC